MAKKKVVDDESILSTDNLKPGYIFDYISGKQVKDCTFPKMNC